MSHRTLIALAIVLTGLAFFAAEADFWSEHESLQHHHYRSTGFTSLRIAYDGDIELNADQTGVIRMSPDAMLEVGQRRFTSRRRLEVRPDASGNPTYSYKIGARKQSPEEAQEYLASMMGEIVRTTTVGAHARARRLLADDGLDELLREVYHLDSNSARRIYLETAAAHEGVEQQQAREIIETAGQAMTSSSRLRATLVDLAEEFPAEWQLNAALAEAAEQIASSSEKRRALVEAARLRGIAPDAEAFADAAATIAAGSEKARAIIGLHDIEPTPQLAAALLSTADTIQAGSERRRTLIELAARPGLPEEVYSKALEVASGIASSSDRATVLVAMAPHLSSAAVPIEPTLDPTPEATPESGEVSEDEMLAEATPMPIAAAGEVHGEAPVEMGASVAEEMPTAPVPMNTAATEALNREYIEVAVSISASSEARRALMALSAAANFSEEVCRQWLDSTVQLASTSTVADLLVEGAAVCPGSDKVWRSYLAAVERLPSSSEQRRTLLALLDRNDLSEETLRNLATVAERRIASTSEREAVLQRLGQVRREAAS